MRPACLVCKQPLGLGWLMCDAHWRLVPASVQDRALRAYGRAVRERSGCQAQHVQHLYSLAIAGAAAVTCANLALINLNQSTTETP